ncbi:MAG: hypothetical protein AAGF11_07895 [Myxococcota bacterium]
MNDTRASHHRYAAGTITLMLVLVGACGDPEGDSGSSGPTTTNGMADSSVDPTTTSSPNPMTSGFGSTGDPNDTSTPGDSTTTGPPPMVTTSGAGSESGSEGGSGSSSGDPPAACGDTPIGGEHALIDDLEVEPGEVDPDSNIIEHDGRVGSWYVYNDGSGGGLQNGGDAFMPQPGGAEGSAYTARTWGEGFDTWGAGMGVAINASMTDCPYDAAAFEGISFWARGTGTVRVQLPIMATVPTEAGGTCSGVCYDTFGLEVELTDVWTFYAFAWDELAQQGWGDPAMFDPQELMQVQWQAPAATEFDIYVDTLSFWPEGPAGGSSGGSDSGGSDSGGSDSGGFGSGTGTGTT